MSAPGGRPGRPVVVGTAFSLVVLAAGVALPPHVRLPVLGRASTAVWLALAWLGFAAASWFVGRLAVRAAVPLIILGGLALLLLAGFTPPHSSDDMYRYSWDGRVQAAGVDPYRYPPAATELAFLRDGHLWPAEGPWCVTVAGVDGGTDAGTPRGDLAPGCTRINRPGVHTIYPPVAEALFVVVYRLSPPGARYQPWQLLAVAFALATTVLLVAGLRRLGLDPRRAALWAWCPTVAVEAGNNAHIDVAAAFLAGAGLLVLVRSAGTRRTLLGGVLIGLAIAAKLTPALLLPAVLRRRPVAVATAVLGAVALVYLPHLLAVGTEVIGYVPGYLHEEGYADGSRFALLTWWLPARWATGAAAVILAAVALVVWATTRADRPWPGAAAMAGTALLVTTPSYPWYAIALVLLVALGARASWLAVAAAGYLAQYANQLGIAPVAAQRLGYGLAGVVVLAAAAVGWSRRRPMSRAGGSAKTSGHSATTEPARSNTADRRRGEVMLIV